MCHGVLAPTRWCRARASALTALEEADFRLVSRQNVRRKDPCPVSTTVPLLIASRDASDLILIVSKLSSYKLFLEGN